jgi:hypothetical protein
MRPDPSRVLSGVATTLSTHLILEAKTPFGAYLAGVAAGLTGTVAVEIERIADRLYRENRALVELLADAAPLVDEDIRSRIRTVVAEEAEPPNILVSTLVAANDRLRFLLIEVHEAIESQSTDDARFMDTRIWDELRESTRRRHIGIGAY